MKGTPMSKILHARSESESWFGSWFGRDVLDHTKKYDGGELDCKVTFQAHPNINGVYD